MTYQVKLNWIRTLEHIFASHIFWLKYITNHDKVITNNGSFFFYYKLIPSKFFKLRQVLQITTKLLQSTTATTNNDKKYKLRQNICISVCCKELLIGQFYLKSATNVVRCTLFYRVCCFSGPSSIFSLFLSI